MYNIKNWLRTSMNQDRFTNLSIIYIERDLSNELSNEQIFCGSVHLKILSPSKLKTEIAPMVSPLLKTNSAYAYLKCIEQQKYEIKNIYCDSRKF
ncbi:zinc finger MYM-type protein 1-like [Aphis craccivora]|uniref:Zinc finger MYM-type protein 1-like n=1 Tax=Aphis craccivora TaxID=307492 RepID=A0A6G0Z3M5_APHCR|nr:zinc finger MYM-type protein 1-like [Aphis craccivora]